MNQLKKKMLGAALGLAATGLAGTAAQAACCKDPLNADPADITYRMLHSAGVRVPAYNQQQIGENLVQFDIHEKDINKWDFLWASTMGLYGVQTSDRDRPCPYINIDDRYFSKEYREDGTIRIKMQVGPAIRDIVVRHGCVITDRPDP